MITRRHAAAAIAGTGFALLAGPARAAPRIALPGGGAIALPRGYKPMAPTDAYFEPGVKTLIAFKNWRTTLSGYPECDGMIAAAPSAAFAAVDDFCANAQTALTIQWRAARETPGRWDGSTAYFPLQRGAGPSGDEIWRQLVVHRVGFWDVYDKGAVQYGRADVRGVLIGIWIFDSDGGRKRAQQLGDAIARSYRG